MADNPGMEAYGFQTVSEAYEVTTSKGNTVSGQSVSPGAEVPKQVRTKAVLSPLF